MLFDDKKLQMEFIDDLIQCPVHTIEPFALMLAPVYVLMKLNKKFVSVKAPLDFFTPQELERLKSYEIIFLPKFVKRSVRFQTAARLIRNMLTHDPEILSPSPQQISQESFSVLSQLWGKQTKIEPFFMSIFTDQLCASLDSEKMLWAREHAVIKHDQGLLLSGALVFVAMHLGWFNLEILNHYRTTIYERTVHGEEWISPQSELEFLVCDLNKIINRYPEFNLQVLETVSSEWSKKLGARLSLFRSKNTNMMYESESIFGSEGFAA